MTAKKPKRNTNIPWLRTRLQQSGRIFYYLEIPKSSDRAEVSLGCDLSKALDKREKFLVKFRNESREEVNDLKFVIELYKEIAIPTFDIKKRKENSFTVTKLESFIAHCSMEFKDIDDPELPARYAQWRNPKFTILIKNELSFLKVLKKAWREWLPSNP